MPGAHDGGFFFVVPAPPAYGGVGIFFLGRDYALTAARLPLSLRQAPFACHKRALRKSLSRVPERFLSSARTAPLARPNGPFGVAGETL